MLKWRERESGEGRGRGIRGGRGRESFVNVGVEESTRQNWLAEDGRNGYDDDDDDDDDDDNWFIRFSS